MGCSTDPCARPAVPRLACALVLAMALLATGCSSGDGSKDDASTGDTTAARTADRTCDQGATVDPVVSAPVEGVPSDVNVTSFDGTLIRAHWFPAQEETSGGAPAPTVLMGPGWGQPGATEERDSALGYGSMPIRFLRSAGYNMLTWDPRGFGASSGEATANSPEVEGRDVQVLLDWVATRPEALLDRDGDPRVGMIGGSYSGGIQLIVGAIDCRVDALVPGATWHSLVTSLYPNDTAKAGWTSLLNRAAVAFNAKVDPHVGKAATQALGTGVLDEEVLEWFRSRGPGDLVGQITAPTLLVHGTVDNLFTPTEGVTNFEALQKTGAPVSMLWFCGGHGICLTGDGDTDLVNGRTRDWLDRYLKGFESVDTGPVMDVVDQNGERWVGDDYPSEPDSTLVAQGPGGNLTLDTESKTGTATAPNSGDLFSSIFAGVTPARADKALKLKVVAKGDALVFGAPRLRLNYRGETPDGPEPTRIFAQLIDDETGLVVGNQIVPVPLELDGDDHTVEIDLEVVAHHLTKGSSVTLQLVATTFAFAEPRLGGTLIAVSIELELPVTEALTPARP
jgi:ABC-2 type transport system ATP-binding protein